MLTFLLVILRLLSEVSGFCKEGDDDCWPGPLEILSFKRSLSGELLQPNDEPQFSHACEPNNNLVTIRPWFILLPALDDTVSDIQKSIEFVRKHDLLLSIYSTGHSRIGRSSGKYVDSFQINFRYHNRSGFDSLTNPTKIWTEPGVTFGPLYERVNELYTQYGITRLVTGGGCFGVGVCGYNLGGGFSGISPFLGLGMDSVLEYDVILANGSFVTVNDVSHPKLFWALKGGGGGTFGIVTNMTLKLHTIPNSFSSGFTYVNFTYEYYQDGMNVGKAALLNFFNSLPNYSNRVNAYVTIFIQMGAIERWQKYNLNFRIIYIGDEVDAMAEIGDLVDLYESTTNQKAQILWNETWYDSIREVSPFTGEGRTIPVFNLTANPNGRTKMFSSAYSVKNVTSNEYMDALDAYLDDISRTFNNTGVINFQGAFLVQFTIIGHNVSRISSDSTSSNPGWRSSQVFMTATVGYFLGGGTRDEDVQNLLNRHITTFQALGKGAYFNEDSNCSSNWMYEYWGEKHYYELLAIKLLYDPKPHLFNCRYCIGDNETCNEVSKRL